MKCVRVCERNYLPSKAKRRKSNVHFSSIQQYTKIENLLLCCVLSSQNSNHHFRAHFAHDGVCMKMTMSAKIIIKINGVVCVYHITLSIYLEIFGCRAEWSRAEQIEQNRMRQN